MKNQLLAFALLALTIATPAAASTQPRVGTDSEALQWSSGTYRYDGAGNILRIGADVYRYDAASRLVHATADTPQHRNTQTFAYDTFGNLWRIDTTSVRDGAAPNTLATIIGIDPRTNRTSPQPCTGINDGTCLFGTYDEAGNQNWTSAGVQYEYDAAGMVVRLRSITRQEEYVYDANNERIATIGALETRVTLRDLEAKVARELTLRNGTAQWKKDYVYRDGTLLAAILPNARHHFHLDHLGTPRLITDDHGMKVSLHTYWPFGAEAPGSEPDAERMKFTGHERDFGAGPGEDHDYMHARYYNPMGGRFLAIDPTWESADARTPQSWNRYAYVRNNPIGNSDPDGKICLPCVAAGAAIGGFVGAARESYRQVMSGQPADNVKLWTETAKGAAVGAGTVFVLEAAPALITRVATSAAATKAALEATKASVDDKLQRYILNPDHPKGGSKAAWFKAALGFTRENAAALARQLKFDESKAVALDMTEYGQKFNQVHRITGANGKVIDVTFGWIRNNDGIVRLVTAIPAEK